MKKAFGFYIILTLLFFAATASYALISADVSVINLNKKNLSKTLTLYGSISSDPGKTVTISLPINGYIQNINVNTGQLVLEKSPLLTFTPEVAESLKYQKLLSTLGLARSELERTQRLYQEQLATRSQLATAEKNLKDAKEALDTAHAMGSDEKSKIITAPIDGIVTQITATPGSPVSANTVIMALNDCHHLILKLDADPDDVSELKDGQLVEIVPFSSHKILNGIVIKIGHQLNPQTRLIDVWVNISHADCNTVFPGASAKAQIVLSTMNLWAIPKSALLSDQQGAFIYRIKNNHAYRVNVKKIIVDHDWVGIESNDLHENDQVVSTGNYELQNGLSVRIVK